MILKMIRLDNERRARLAEIAWKSDAHEIAPPHRHPAGRARSESAASMKPKRSESSRSASAPAFDCRRHSAANPGARESGAQIWTGRSPDFRKASRRVFTRAETGLDIPTLVAIPVTCNTAPVEFKPEWSACRGL